ncbi:hypothetical protein MVEN_00887200 [Mycena venus]|uniref:Protein kinase domain-containing protein n=1 Tax=Mycena venus TaxID=2733690 RepID=A0A8H6YGY7_9AGAR|nr:hypothetical protein MVEN_00887200 [Mycena venus]
MPHNSKPRKLLTGVAASPGSSAQLIRGTTGRLVNKWFSDGGALAGRIADRLVGPQRGPDDIFEEIISHFGTEEHRVSCLAALPNGAPPEVEQKCSELVKHTLPSQKTGPKVQLLAFQHIVTLATLLPGLRLLFLRSKELQGKASKDSLEELWKRPDNWMNEEWEFWRSFASICLSETCISGVLEECPVEELANCQIENGGRCVIDRLISEASDNTNFSDALCIRYLAGILALPGFWRALESTRCHRVTKRICMMMIQVLEDLDVDVKKSEPTQLRDYDGIDFLVDTILYRISIWLRGIDPPKRRDQPWYAKFLKVVDLICKSRSAKELPRSYNRAISESFVSLITGVFTDLPDDIRVEADNEAVSEERISQGNEPAEGPDLPTRGSSPVSDYDDTEGHYIIVPDDMIYRRYRTVQLLGRGISGKVVEAVDTQTDTKVAIKIIRAIPKYRDASKNEVRVLRKLQERDPLNRYKCIHVLHWFDHRNHICIVSELFGMCLYDFLEENNFAPFPRQHIQSFARQLLGSVAFLHDLHLIHTDLRLENILLVHNDYKTVHIPISGRRNVPPKAKQILHSTDIRLIDFGSATFENESHASIVSKRKYRAPEIILGLGWSYPCDVYSLGCILVELFTGMALFQTHDNLEHLAMMEMVMGKMPNRFARAGARSKPELFKDNVSLDWPEASTDRQSKKKVLAMRHLSDVVPPHDLINRHFLNLVQKLLNFDPAQRITAREALNHPYFALIIANEI